MVSSELKDIDSTMMNTTARTFHATEFIIDGSRGEGFCIGNT